MSLRIEKALAELAYTEQGGHWGQIVAVVFAIDEGVEFRGRAGLEHYFQFFLCLDDQVFEGHETAPGLAATKSWTTR